MTTLQQPPDALQRIQDRDMPITAVPVDAQRRFWITATTVVGGTGLVASAVPFVASLAPSDRARALGAGVEVELQTLRPGDIRTVEWRGKPVFVLSRSQDMLDSLARHDSLLADPTSRRSIQPEPTRNAGRSLIPGVVAGSRLHPPRLHPQLSADAGCLVGLN